MKRHSYPELKRSSLVTISQKKLCDKFIIRPFKNPEFFSDLNVSWNRFFWLFGFCGKFVWKRNFPFDWLFVWNYFLWIDRRQNFIEFWVKPTVSHQPVLHLLRFMMLFWLVRRNLWQISCWLFNSEKNLFFLLYLVDSILVFLRISRRVWHDGLLEKHLYLSIMFSLRFCQIKIFKLCQTFIEKFLFRCFLARRKSEMCGNLPDFGGLDG